MYVEKINKLFSIWKQFVTQFVFSNDNSYEIEVGAPKNELLLAGDKIRLGATNA
jgi:hypothetical protein